MSQSVVKSNVLSREVHPSRRHKILSVVALSGLFLCGLFVGVSFNGRPAPRHHAQFTKLQCENLQDKISNAIRSADVEKMESLQRVFARSCSDFVAEPKPVKVETNKELETCEKIEELLLDMLHDDGDREVWAHVSNAKIYDELISRGCPKNVEKFKKMQQSELEIADSLKKFDKYYNESTIDEAPCAVIERELGRKIMPCNDDDFCGYENYLNNAEIYSTMSERGCPENSQKYKEQALAQIEIASALDSNKEMMRSENKAEAVIDTYKKLKMQNQARDFLNKMQRLVEPSVDFIMTMEKVINE